MLCKKCQNVINKNAKFCTFCGAEIDKEELIKETRKKEELSNTIMGIIFLSIFILTSIFVYIRDIKNENSTNINNTNYSNESEYRFEDEIESDENYYNIVCNNCKYHREKIKQNIREGGDAKWWKYMCTDFCKDYTRSEKNIKKSKLIQLIELIDPFRDIRNELK